MNFLKSFGRVAEIDIEFEGAEFRKKVEIKTEECKKEKYFLYYDGESVTGKVNVIPRDKKFDHKGIKIELIGLIDFVCDKTNPHNIFCHEQDLARPGELNQNTSYPFSFANIAKPHETYFGSHVRLRYFLRVTIQRLFDIVSEFDIAVHTLHMYPETSAPIKMEVGIEESLHIEFEYNKSKYHLKDVIVGKIYFLLVRLEIKHMEILIIKRESTLTGVHSTAENETIVKYEIMDGAPVKGESIPIRVFLGSYDLTPTMLDVCKKFSVRYFLNLVLMDKEDRRYFKQQEIKLWRKSDKMRKPIGTVSTSIAGAIATQSYNSDNNCNDNRLKKLAGMLTNIASPVTDSEDATSKDKELNNDDNESNYVCCDSKNYRDTDDSDDDNNTPSMNTITTSKDQSTVEFFTQESPVQDTNKSMVNEEFNDR